MLQYLAPTVDLKLTQTIVVTLDQILVRVTMKKILNFYLTLVPIFYSFLVGKMHLTRR